jgi:peptide/nickel transport system ATP-binding protein
LPGKHFCRLCRSPDASIEKRRIVLEGDILSAINPPPGCETILPPMTTFGEGHLIRCHLSRAILDEMEPVITQVGQKRSMER